MSLVGCAETNKAFAGDPSPAKAAHAIRVEISVMPDQEFAIRPSGVSADSAKDELLPGCTVTADLEQVLALYADLAQRTILRSHVIPQLRMVIDMPSSHHLEEAKKALELALAMNGIGIVPAGNNYIKATWFPEVSASVSDTNVMKQYSYWGSAGDPCQTQ